MRNLVRIAAVTAIVLAAPAAGFAQSGPTPQQIQGQIAAGQEQTALSELGAALQAHPTSGVAWYLTAEAQDAAGNENAARGALAKAQQYAPGLPFAQPNAVAALQAHLAGSGGQQAAPAAPPRSGISPAIMGIGLLVVLFIVFRMFMRSRRRMVAPYQGGYGPAPGPGNAPYPYNPGGMPYGGGGMGGGIGGGLISGLAAGAGFAAGERLLGDLMGGGNNNVEPTQNVEPVPERDDGLNGSPGWGDGGGVDNSGTIDSGGGFDSGNSW